MSQQIPFPAVPHERVYLKYQVLPRTNNNTVRSGIIERYTYKTDNGKLLSSTSLNKTYNAGDNVSVKPVSPQNSTNLHTSIPSVSRTTIIKTNVTKSVERSLPTLATKHHVIHQNVTLLKLGNSSREEDEKVRTEHCDSTTDIVENMEKETMKILENEEKFFADDDFYERSPSICNSGDPLEIFNSPQQSCDIDSDSDCQIIDVKLSDSKISHVSNNKDRYPVSQDEILTQNSDKTSVVIDNLSNNEESPNTKVLSWITTKVDEPEPSVVHVISDSEEEDDCKMFLCDKTGMKKTITEIIYNNSNSTSSVYKSEEQSTSLSSLSGSSSPDLSVSNIDNSSKMPDSNSVVLINAKYHSVMNRFSPETKIHMTLNSTELNQQNILKPAPTELCSSAKLLNKTPPRPVLGSKLQATPPKVQKLNVHVQKVNSEMSPDSMKSEFYSYLKINTNPLAQKAETVAQNRRSTRVKNLILQIEKNKELKKDSTANEKNKSNDVRKKFMKYSKLRIVFPPPPIQHNKISDFNQSIETYFLREKIKFSTSLFNLGDKDDRRNKTEILQTKKCRINDSVDLMGNRNKKYISKRKLLKSKLTQNNESNFNSQVIADNKKLRRLRYRPNRINTSVRITRNSLDGCKMWNIKMLKARKAKLKAKLKEKNLEAERQKSETIIAEKLELEKSTLCCTSSQVEQLSVSNLLAKELPNKLQEPDSKLDSIPKSLPNCEKMFHETKHEQINETENFSLSSNDHLDTESKITKKGIMPLKIFSSTPVVMCSKDNKSLEFTLHTTINSTESEKRLCIFKSESEKELEFFTSANRDTKVQHNAKLEQNTLRKYNMSPPFLGFTSDENTNRQNIQSFVTTVKSQVSLIEDTIKPIAGSNLLPEIQEYSCTTDSHLPEIISLSSSNNDTSMEEEDSNSEQFSETSTSSVQEEIKINVQEVVDTNLIETGNPSYIPLNQNIRPKSFHKSLMQACVKRKSTADTTRSSLFELSDSDSSISTPKTPKGVISKRSQTHEIDINKNNGAVFNTYYVNGILVIVQELLITFWKQTALGNILGVQNMWLPHGSIQRIILDPGCVNRRSSEMVLSCDNSVAYVELWTKEHKCVYRECPIADVFATIYFHKGHGIPDKKVLQLENIKGYGDDVRFAVIKNSREIIVSWCDTFSKPVKTLVRSYQLSSDYQSVSSIQEMEFVSHYISSLHNIHDCDDLVLGAGNEQISVWNLRHGYLVTTLNLSELSAQTLSEHKTICLYVQCDAGFLFVIQQTEVGILRLVAVNGMTQDWKQLHSYQVPENYKKLLGVIVESGVLMTCYTNGFLCWNMHSGEVLAEIDTPNELIVLPSNKYMVAIDNYQVTVQHIMSYILTHDW